MKSLQFLAFLVFGFAFVSACKPEEDPIIKDPVVVPKYTQYGTPFAQVPANEDIVMYEVNLRAFSASGDLPGVIARLDELKALHVNVIWLMPIYPMGIINSVNSPYSVRDYKAVSEEYGSLEDLRTLTDEAHARGMTVILDWVANHTAWDNEWIYNTSWYTQDGAGNIIHPAGTNWQDVADLNYTSSAMRLAMIDALEYWVYEANVDGFRCDHADGVPYDFWNQAFDSLAKIPNRSLVLLAEGSRSDHFTAGFGLNYGWDFYGALKNVYAGQAANKLFTANANENASTGVGKERLRFTTNHDESAWDASPMSLFGGKDGALAASVAAIFMGGVPMIYTGQEVGRTGTTPFFTNSPTNWSANPDMLQAYKDILGFYSGSAIAKKGTNTNYADNDIVCFKKTFNNESLLIVVNVRNAAKDFTIPSDLQNTTWVNALSESAVEIGSTLALAPYQYLILKQ